MAGSGMRTLKNGLRTGMRATAYTGYFGDVEQGYGTPTHASGQGTLYVKLDATQGTTWLYRKHVTASTTWTPQSDD